MAGCFCPAGNSVSCDAFLRLRVVSNESTVLAPFVAALYYSLFQMIFGLVIMLPPSLERLRPFEPMRYLHLLYLLFFLIAGGLLGDHVLKRKKLRWLLFLP